MDVQVFVDDDEGYLLWLRGHYMGYVVNAERSLSAQAELRLHEASCPTISGQPPGGSHWTGPYLKACADRKPPCSAGHARRWEPSCCGAARAHRSPCGRHRRALGVGRRLTRACQNGVPVQPGAERSGVRRFRRSGRPYRGARRPTIRSRTRLNSSSPRLPGETWPESGLRAITYPCLDSCGTARNQ
jgi:hypothetical protein